MIIVKPLHGIIPCKGFVLFVRWEHSPKGWGLRALHVFVYRLCGRREISRAEEEFLLHRLPIARRDFV
jgi:hypothetical protein